MRIRNPWIVFLFLVLCCAVEWSWGSNATTATPLLVHDPQTQREFQNVYQSINAKSSIYSGGPAPASAPSKVGDVYISTNTVHMYMSTATKDSNSWLLIK